MVAHNANRKIGAVQMPRVHGSLFARGFTLIELIVVITIIIILMAILLPALSYAKQQAYVSATTSELQSIRAVCQQYFQSFGSYPGLFKDSDVAATSGTGSFSGAQNLYLSLLGAVIPSSPTTVNLPGGGTTSQTSTQTITVNGNSALFVSGNPGPNDFTPVNGNNNVKQWPVFYPPATREVAFVSSTANSNYSSIVPVLVDHFPDALPILYYRCTPGVDGTVANYPVTAVAIGSPGGTLGAAYYTGCNAEYTGTKVTAISGTVYDNSATYATGSGSTPYGSTRGGDTNTYTPLSTSILQTDVSNVSTGKVSGGFVLIAAGKSRYYGSITPSGGTAATDAIVVVGGQ